ncbi:MAG: hypothetical protein NT129_05030 [Candidatus Aenigmarchaeota archaeon]|nr:hypothetical protein [Candidatus Aenigmarchaeota archaeon]
MNELVKNGIINLLSISIASLILLFLAEYDITLIFNQYLLGFIIVCAIAAVFINRYLAGIWGSALSVFIAILAVGFVWSLIFNKPIANSPLFVVMAVPAAISNIVIWKLWKAEPSPAKKHSRHLNLKR